MAWKRLLNDGPCTTENMNPCPDNNPVQLEQFWPSASRRTHPKHSHVTHIANFSPLQQAFASIYAACSSHFLQRNVPILSAISRSYCFLKRDNYLNTTTSQFIYSDTTKSLLECHDFDIGPTYYLSSYLCGLYSPLCILINWGYAHDYDGYRVPPEHI